MRRQIIWRRSISLTKFLPLTPLFLIHVLGPPVRRGAYSSAKPFLLDFLLLSNPSESQGTGSGLLKADGEVTEAVLQEADNRPLHS